MTTDKTMASPAIPFAVACLGIALFSVMDGVMKGLSIGIGAYNALLWRCLLGAAIMGCVALMTGQTWPARSAIRLHAVRGIVTAIMAFTFFWGVARVPLAEGIAISFISPIIALILAAVFLKEVIHRSAVAASLCGFAGVVVIAGGRIGSNFSSDALWGMIAILISAIFYAANLVLTRMQAQIASPAEIALFQNVTVALILGLIGLAAPTLVVVPLPRDMPAIAVAAVLTILSLLLLSWAYARAQTQHLLPVEYTAFIWASIIGYLVFGEHVTVITVLGTLLIIVGCIIAARTRNA